MSAPVATRNDVPEQVIALLAEVCELMNHVSPSKREQDRVFTVRRLVNEAKRKATVRR